MDEKKKAAEEEYVYKIETKKPAPESIVLKFSLKDFIEEICYGTFYSDVLDDWFNDYLNKVGDVPQGERLYGEKIIKKNIECSDGSGKLIDIPVSGNTLDEEKELLMESMGNGDILIEGSVDWSSGYWQTFFITLNSKIEFDKIEAIMECGLIVDYVYNGKESGWFESDDDWELEDGYSGACAYIFWDKKLHEIDLDEISDLEDDDEKYIFNYFLKKYS